MNGDYDASMKTVDILADRLNFLTSDDMAYKGGFDDFVRRGDMTEFVRALPASTH